MPFVAVGCPPGFTSRADDHTTAQSRRCALQRTAMGNESTLLTEADARHLLRRTGFGAPRDQVQRLLDMGATRGRAVDELLAFNTKGFKPSAPTFQGTHDKWIKFLVKT